MASLQTKHSLLRTSSVLLGVAIMLRLMTSNFAQATPAATAQPAWANPSTMTLQKVGYVPSAGPGHSAFVDNFDCQVITKPLAGSGTPQTGCFMSTAFGALDVENDIISFNGADDNAVPLLPYSPHEFIWPWPGTVNALALDAAPTDGVYLNLYTNILKDVSDRFDSTGTAVIAKQITAPPNKLLTDRAGNRLIVNANSLTFSYGGSWLVAETMTGSFVRINLATLDVTAFAPSFIRVGMSAGLDQSQLAVSRDGRYVAIANRAADAVRIYDLDTCKPDAGRPFMACSSYNYWPFMSGQLSGVDSLRHLRFLNDGLLGLIVVSGNTLTSYALAPTAGISAITDYLALGDSYTSGEGAFAYLASTNSPDNDCHISANSYPLLLAHSTFTPAGGHSVACSGATADDVLPRNQSIYSGQVTGGVAKAQRTETALAQLLNDFTPGNIAQADFVSHYQPRIITASIGGNDIGFGSILAECAVPHISTHLTGDNNCFSTYEDRFELAQRIDREAAKLTALFKQVHSLAPNSSLYVVGYPQIAVDTGSCALNVHLDTNEIGLSIDIIEHLNAAISSAARASGSTYVDISQALVGHRLCETASGQVAINGLTAGDAGGITLTTELGNKLAINFLGSESYHPNILGHELIKRAILLQTKNFSAAPTANADTYLPAVNDTQRLLKAPKTGRTIKQTTSDEKIVSSHIVAKGSTVQLKTTKAKAGLKPSSNYRVTVGSGASPQSIGTLTTTNTGDLVGIVTLSNTTPAGAQIITIEGQNELNQPISITTIIYIFTNPDDYDNDGLDNGNDSCPTVVNSGLDADRDGIDDACDGTIDEPPITGSTDSSAAGISGPTSASEGGSTAPPLVIEPISPPIVTVANNPPATQPSGTSQGATNALVSVDPFTVASGRVTTVSTFLAGQGRHSSVNATGIKAVLGAQTTDPSTLRKSARLEPAATVPTSQVQRFGGVRILNLLAWARLLVISLLALLIISTVLGRVLKRTILAN